MSLANRNNFLKGQLIKVQRSPELVESYTVIRRGTYYLYLQKTSLSTLDSPTPLTRIKMTDPNLIP